MAGRRDYRETVNNWRQHLQAAYPLVLKLTVSGGYYVTEDNLYKVDGTAVRSYELAEVVKKVEAEMGKRLDKLASALYHVVTDLPEASVHFFDGSPELAREWGKESVQTQLHQLLFRMLRLKEVAGNLAEEQSRKEKSCVERLNVAVFLSPDDPKNQRECSITLLRRAYSGREGSELRITTSYYLLALLHIERLRAALSGMVDSVKRIEAL